MKKIIIAACTICFFSGCVKTNLKEIIENTKKDTRPDYWLSFTHREKGRGYNQAALNLNDAGELAAGYSIKANTLKLRIGYLHTRPVIPPGYAPGNLYTIVYFPFASRPEDIVGEYPFPVANSTISFNMFYAVNGDTTRRVMPDYGTLEVQYDAATKTLYGKLRNITFRQPQLGNEVADKLIGRFHHIPFEQ
jgi:hypothetical protein